MSQYIIRHVDTTIDWANIPSLPIHCLLWSPEVPIRAEAKICYGEDALHVRLSAWEPHIRAENYGPLGMPCEDSCLEFFFCPVPEDSRYFNVEINPNGCVYLGFGSKPDNLVRLLPAKPVIVPNIERMDGGWQVSYQIPFSFIREFFPNFHAVSGSTIRGNCYKCGDLTVQEHYLSAFPIGLKKPNFHCPEYFSALQFE